jgi:hypothetical protein
MHRNEACLQLPDPADQIEQGGSALRIPIGVGKLNAKMLFVHRVFTDQRLDGSDRCHNIKLARSTAEHEREHAHLPRLLIKPIRDNRI